MDRPHILLVVFPSQGHINPSLQLAKRLLDHGAVVTFSTSTSSQSQIAKSGAYYAQGLSFTAFSDGSEDGFDLKGDTVGYMAQLRLHGSQTVSTIIAESIKSDRPFTCVVYSNLIPWVAAVAREFQLPSTLLWLQPAIILDLYHYYCVGGYSDSINKSYTDPEFLLKLPGLPPLASSDLPSFFNPKNTIVHALPVFKEHVEFLAQESNPTVLVNTFDDLESDALKSIGGNYKLVGVGPLIPQEISDPSDVSIINWLNSKQETSVIYISLGSISVWSEAQMEQMGRALLYMGRPFLWVNRSEGQKSSVMEELEKQGMMVPWCCQVEILSHPSIGCFFTHCGWNSTSESLAYGVPVVAFPQWTDQLTNAKMVMDVWKTGVRVKPNDDGVLEAGEIKRCVELVMGEDEMRVNAKKWKDLARKSFHEGGSSYKNTKAFVDEAREANKS